MCLKGPRHLRGRAWQDMGGGTHSPPEPAKPRPSQGASGPTDTPAPQSDASKPAACHGL